MTKQHTKYKKLLEDLVLPILRENFYGYSLTGEYNYGNGSTKDLISVTSSQNSYILMGMYHECKFFKEFTENMLSNGIMRTSWYAYCRKPDHPKLALIKKYEPVFREVFDRYTLMLVDMPDPISGNRTYMIVKSGCDGLYASYLLLHGYKKAMDNETVTC